MKNYFYQIANGMNFFDTLSEARKVQQDIIKNDVHTCKLFRDNKGYFILKEKRKEFTNELIKR